MLSGPEQLADWMKRRNVNQREAAVILGLDFTVVNKLLNGFRSPGLQTAITIERATGIPVEAWLPTEGGSSEPTAAETSESSR